MTQGYHFNFASVCKNSILSILKLTQVSKATGLDSLSGRFLKDREALLAKSTIGDLCNLSINSEKIPDLCKVVKLKPLYKNGFITHPCNYTLPSLLPLISKVIEKVIPDQTSKYLSEFPELHLPIWFLKKALYNFFPFLFEWQNFRGLWQKLDML